MSRDEVIAILDGAERKSIHYGREVAVIQGDLEEVHQLARVVHGLTQWSSQHQPLQADSNMLPPCF